MRDSNRKAIPLIEIDEVDYMMEEHKSNHGDDHLSNFSFASSDSEA